MSKNKICVYTCITGDYDNLKEINPEKGIDYYCFTNNKDVTSKTWNIVYIEDNKLSNVQLARKIKILGHPIINEKYGILLWMDGAIVFQKKIRDFVNYYMTDKDNFVSFAHGERTTVKDECFACVKYRKEKKETVKKLLQFLENEKYPDNNGLIESTVYIKRTNNKIVDETMKMWFEMILKYTKRDQLSFNYCAYKTGLKVKWINQKVFDNNWFKWINHNYETETKSYRLYFGDEESEKYNIDYDIQKNYIIENDNYFVRVKIPRTTNLCVLELSNVPCIKIENFEIKSPNQTNYEMYNCISFKKGKVFFKAPSVVKIVGNFKKNDEIKINFSLKKLEMFQIYELIDYLNETAATFNNEKKKIEEENKELKAKIDIIINSKGWKLLEKLRKINVKK